MNQQESDEQRKIEARYQIGVTNGVKERKDSNERKGECLVVMEGIHCWEGSVRLCEGKKSI